MRGSQRQRLLFLEAVLQKAGAARRVDIVEEFGVSPAQASVDIRRYRELAPANMVYEPRVKAYLRATDFAPKFEKCVCACCGHPHARTSPDQLGPAEGER